MNLSTSPENLVTLFRSTGIIKIDRWQICIPGDTVAWGKLLETRICCGHFLQAEGFQLVIIDLHRLPTVCFIVKHYQTWLAEPILGRVPVDDTWLCLRVIFIPCNCKFDGVGCIRDGWQWFCFKRKSEVRCIWSVCFSFLANQLVTGSSYSLSAAEYLT